MKNIIVTASVDIPIKLSYQCSYCGAENFDRDEYIHVSGSAGGMTRYGLADIADARLSQNTKNLGLQILNRNYDGKGLICRCNRCGREEAWSKVNHVYPSRLVFVVSGIIYLALMLLFVALDLEGLALSLMYVGLFGVFFAAFGFPLIRRMLWKNQIKMLPKNSMPNVSFRKL